MKITDVKHFLANPGRGKNLCFVKVETDEGSTAGARLILSRTATSR